jgi:serine protease DegQ
MKKIALYSSSSRTRKPAAIGSPEDASAASDPPVPPAIPAAPGRLRRFYARFERTILLVGGALFAIALVMTYAKSRPAAQEFTQKDIDAAVLHTLENAQLPSFAAKAFAAIEPSVVRVMGYGPDAADDEDEGIDKEKRKGKNSEKDKAGKAGKAGKDGKSASRDTARDKAGSVAKDRLARNESGKDGAGAGAKESTGKSGADGKDGKGKDRSADNGNDGKPGHHGATGVGTGVVIVDKGIILTNLHVVVGAQRIKVRFFDGMEAEATVIGMRPEHDLAVLQAKAVPDDLVAATLRSTADLQIGDQVVAVGFPFGIGPSATSGVVSGLRREYQSPEGKRILTNLIQFDAAANPGNSGGPLVTADGEVVGIVTGILNPTSQRVFIGIGFAVPIENAAAAVGMSPF